MMNPKSLDLLLEKASSTTYKSIVRRVNSLLDVYYKDLKKDTSNFHIDLNGNFELLNPVHKAKRRDLYDTIGQQTDKLFSDIEEIYLDEMSDLYDKCYLLTTKAVSDKEYDMLTMNAMISSSKADDISADWSGLDYSARLTNHRDSMKFTIISNLGNSIRRGDTAIGNYNAIVPTVKSRISKLQTLFETEVQAIRTHAQKGAYDTNRVKRVKIINTAQGGCHKIWGGYVATSVKDCKSQVGKIVELKDALVGIDLPPFHPHCACRIVHLEEEE